jgi:TolB-like protein/Flp pilus assembly protein TadD
MKGGYWLIKKGQKSIVNIPDNKKSSESFIFVSYSHVNSDVVGKEISRLQEQNFKIWYDDRISLGTKWREELASSILECDLFLLFISPDYVISDHCQGELHLALEHQCPVLAVHLEPTELTPGLKLAIGDRQHLFKYEMEEEAYQQQLLTGITEIFQNPNREFSPGRPYQAKQPPKKINYTLATLLIVMTLGLALLIKMNVDPPAETTVVAEFTPTPNSIAVMPFLNLGGNLDSQYFSDGISEEILNALSTVPNLVVTARTSSFSLRDANLDIPSIGRRLNVGRVLEGSVRKSGDTVRISVQLIDAVNGFELWSSVYERVMEDIFVIQKDISNSVVSALEIEMELEDSGLQGQVENIEAYDLYLLGRHKLYERTASSISASIELFQRAILLDPGLVLAYTGLADAYNLLTAYGNLSGPDAAAKMQPVLEKALELDPNLAEVHNSLGAMKENSGDLLGAEEAYRVAIQLNPNYALAYMWLGNLLINQSRLEEARDAFRKALQLDPLHVIVNINVARVEMLSGDFAAGLKHLDHSIELAPDSPHAHARKSYWLSQYGYLDEALNSARMAIEIDESGVQNLVNLAYVYMVIGDLETAGAWIDRAISTNPDNWQVNWLVSEHYLLSNEYELMDQYTGERLASLLETDEVSRDLKVAYMSAGLAKLVNNESQLAISYLDRAERIEYKLEVAKELQIKALRALAYKKHGQSQRANSLIDESLEYSIRMGEQGWRDPDMVVNQASVFAVKGDHDKALGLLDEAVQLGYSQYLSLEHDPRWEELRERQEFIQLVDSLKQSR